MEGNFNIRKERYFEEGIENRKKKDQGYLAGQ
jgi:hypothetical protein